MIALMADDGVEGHKCSNGWLKNFLTASPRDESLDAASPYPIMLPKK